MVFDTILYRTLQRLIGLKSLAFSGDFVFVMREIKVWFRFSGMFFVFRTERVAAITSYPIKFQQDL